MKDNRLTKDSFEEALISFSNDTNIVLHVPPILLIQAYDVVSSIHSIEIDIESCPEMDADFGYCEDIDATIFFPWKLTSDQREFYSDGSYHYETCELCKLLKEPLSMVLFEREYKGKRRKVCHYHASFIDYTEILEEAL